MLTSVEVLLDIGAMQPTASFVIIKGTIVAKYIEQRSGEPMYVITFGFFQNDLRHVHQVGCQLEILHDRLDASSAGHK